MVFARSSFRPAVRSLITAPLPDGASFLAMTGLVAYGDFMTKSLALALWRNEGVGVRLAGTRLAIQVVQNTVGAFSTSYGPLTWEINVAATLSAVLLAMAVCPRLARLHSLAPAALGLIAGGGVGNLASLVGYAAVPDFIAIGTRGFGLILNFADVAAYLGLACCVRLVWAIGREELRTRVTLRPSTAPSPSPRARPSSPSRSTSRASRGR